MRYIRVVKLGLSLTAGDEWGLLTEDEVVPWCRVHEEGEYNSMPGKGLTEELMRSKCKILMKVQHASYSII